MSSNTGEPFQRINIDTAKEKIDSEECTIVDVRQQDEWDSGHVKNAIHIPRGLLEFTLVPNSSNNPVKIDDNTNILVYCAGGYRSALAAKTLKDLGFKNVYNLGGYSEWVDNGGDVQAHT